MKSDDHERFVNQIVFGLPLTNRQMRAVLPTITALMLSLGALAIWTIVCK